jgi:hypothetical protein
VNKLLKELLRKKKILKVRFKIKKISLNNFLIILEEMRKFKEKKKILWNNKNKKNKIMKKKF